MKTTPVIGLLLRHHQHTHTAKLEFTLMHFDATSVYRSCFRSSAILHAYSDLFKSSESGVSNLFQFSSTFHFANSAQLETLVGWYRPTGCMFDTTALTRGARSLQLQNAFLSKPPYKKLLQINRKLFEQVEQQI